MENLDHSSKEVESSEALYYSVNHIWISVDETLLTLGVTHLVPNKLGEILFFDAPEEGDRIVRDNSFGSLESITDWMALVAPVSGLIVELNPNIIEQPFILNDDPYEGGWILRVEIESEKELVDLIRAAQYKMLSIKRLN